MIEDDTKHPPTKKNKGAVGGKRANVRAHLRRKKSFWDVFKKTPKFNPVIGGNEEERTVVY